MAHSNENANSLDTNLPAFDRLANQVDMIQQPDPLVGSPTIELDPTSDGK